MPTVVTDQTFDQQVLKSDKPVLVDLWAEWCTPCLAQAPIIEEIATKFQDKLSVAKLNVDENTATAQKFDVMSIPTLILFKNGQPVERIIGLTPKERLVAAIQPHL